MGVRFKLVWFDSFGAKSSCTLVETPDTVILIDPGVAIMHPSFPATVEEKALWKEKAREEIIKASREAEYIVISHYHWDHFLPNEFKIYEGKTLFTKNPNEYINDSQRERALKFFTNLWKKIGGRVIRFKNQAKKEFEDPALNLRSIRISFGEYDDRRRELLSKGRRWLANRVNKWLSWKVIPEAIFKKIKVIYPENKEYRIGKTKISFTPPLFHGIEYSRVGWVFSTLIDYCGEKLIHSSDLNGPIIEDYADYLIRENPRYLILDGPMTYMLGYTLNLINLNRVIENVKRIIENVSFEVMIWDHHLPRERNFRKHTEEAWSLAEKLSKKLLTAREYAHGEKPVVEASRCGLNH